MMDVPKMYLSPGPCRTKCRVAHVCSTPAAVEPASSGNNEHSARVSVFVYVYTRKHEARPGTVHSGRRFVPGTGIRLSHRAFGRFNFQAMAPQPQKHDSPVQMTTVMSVNVMYILILIKIINMYYISAQIVIYLQFKIRVGQAQGTAAVLLCVLSVMPLLGRWSWQRRQEHRPKPSVTKPFTVLAICYWLSVAQGFTSISSTAVAPPGSLSWVLRSSLSPAASPLTARGRTKTFTAASFVMSEARAEPRRTLVVIGGGAAGYFGAIQAASSSSSSDLRVVVLEAGKLPLQKVKISGGGRCNVMHDTSKVGAAGRELELEMLVIDVSQYYSYKMLKQWPVRGLPSTMTHDSMTAGRSRASLFSAMIYTWVPAPGTWYSVRAGPAERITLYLPAFSQRKFATFEQKICTELP